MYSRVEYFCDSETAYVREGIDGYKDDEGTKREEASYSRAESANATPRSPFLVD